MIERRIIIGLITSTEFCQKVKDIFNPNLLESTTARKLADWVWQYYSKYNKAPGMEMEALYYSKLKKGNISKDIAEEIEQDILPSLSEDFVSEGVNVEFLVEESVKYFNEQHIKILTDDVQTLLAKGRIEEAADRVKDFTPLESNVDRLDDHIRSVAAIRRKKVDPPLLLMKPWLRSGQLTILYAQYGVGKSLLVLLVAYLLGLDDPSIDEAEIGEWQVKRTTGCLYVDGEIGEVEMEERIKSYEWIGRQAHRLKVFSIPEYQLETDDPFYLSQRVNQRRIIKWLEEHPDYKLIILDSASTLFGIEEENNNSEWNNKVNPFLRDLRALDVACILLHHAGKESRRGLRGASAIGAMAHNIFRLTNHEKKNVDDGEAWFVLTKDKQRSGGKSFRTFSLKFWLEDGDTKWEVTENY